MVKRKYVAYPIPLLPLLIFMIKKYTSVEIVFMRVISFEEVKIPCVFLNEYQK